jgi:hypothetical protein
MRVPDGDGAAGEGGVAHARAPGWRRANRAPNQKLRHCAYAYKNSIVHATRIRFADVRAPRRWQASGRVRWPYPNPSQASLPA